MEGREHRGKMLNLVTPFQLIEKYEIKTFVPKQVDIELLAGALWKYYILNQPILIQNVYKNIYMKVDLHMHMLNALTMIYVHYIYILLTNI